MVLYSLREAGGVSYQCPICRSIEYKHMIGVRRHLKSSHADLGVREISLCCDIAKYGYEEAAEMIG